MLTRCAQTGGMAPDEEAAMTTTQDDIRYEDRPAGFFARLRNLALAPFAVLGLGLLVLVLWRAH